MNIRNLILVTITVASIGCQKASTREKSPTPVKAVVVETTIPQRTNRYSATIRPNTQVDLGFKVGGFVESISSGRDERGMQRTLQPGDVVARGQVLAQLRRSDYQARVNQVESQKGEIQKSIGTSQAQLSEVSASIDVNRSQLREAETSLAQARTDLIRSQNLYRVQSLTKKDLDAATTNADLAEARVNTARASLQTAIAKVKTMEAQIAQVQARIPTADASIAEAKIPLGDTTLRAPQSGVIIERKIEAGALVAPNQPAFTLADTASVKAVFGVPDVELLRLQLGQKLTVTTEALPDETFTGSVSRISPSADANSRVFEIEVTILNGHGMLRPGTIASLELVSDKAGTETSLVPLAAIVRSKSASGSYSVFVVQEIEGEAIARSREVSLGETFGNSVAIEKGLQAGEKVVINGAAFLVDGEKVQVIP